MFAGHVAKVLVASPLRVDLCVQNLFPCMICECQLFTTRVNNLTLANKLEPTFGADPVSYTHLTLPTIYSV